MSNPWTTTAVADITTEPQRIVVLFPAAGRAVGRDPIDPLADPLGMLRGTADDEAREALVGALLTAVPADDAAAALGDLYHHGDDAERRGVLRGLNAAPEAMRATSVVEVGLGLIADALRTNDPRLVAAALGDFAGAHLDDHAWRHGVLKALFMGIPLDVVARLDERADDELERMAAGLVAERRAAGREINDDMRRLASLSPHLDPYAESLTMRIFDPHIHMSARTTDDYRAMYDSGVRAVVEPSFWLGQPRTNVGSFVDYFDALIGWERFRAAQYGIRHHCTIGLNPKEANDPRCREVLDVLPRYLAKDGVVAVGELGYDSMTAEEDEVFAAQLALARDFDLPAMVHTPHRDKAAGTVRTLDVVRESGLAPERVVVDHLNETTVGAVADSGCWMGFSIYPDTKMDELRMVAILREFGTERMLVNSAADWGNSDPLKTSKTARAMLDAGFTDEDVDVVLWQNPVAFYGQSGRLHLDPVPGFAEHEPPAAGVTFEGNSVLRGARA